MTDPAQQLLRVAAARADFLESGRHGAAGVPDVLAASWERSQAAGVSAESPKTDYDDAFDTGSLLVRSARPVLERLGTETADIPLVIALTDPKARLLQRVDSSAAVGRLLDRVDFAPGYCYAETAMGTNGVGTVLEAGRPISIIGPEHFTEYLQPFACTGAPIIDPITRRVGGVLDISCLTQTWSPLMHALVKSAASDISHNLLLDRSQAQQAIFETYLQVVSRNERHPVFAFGESIFMANKAAQAQFDAAEQQTLRDHTTFLMARRARASDTFVLSTGRTVRIRGTRILTANEPVGMVVIADFPTHALHMAGSIHEQVLPAVALVRPDTARIASDLARPTSTVLGGQAPAWVRACENLRDALTDCQATVVIGEAGSGKFTLVAETFHAIHPGGRSVSVGGDDLRGDTPPQELSSLLTSTQEPTLLILRNLDQANTDAVENLAALLTRLSSAERRPLVVATLSDCSMESDLPFHALLDHFDSAITVPPLRLRKEDLPTIVRVVLSELALNRRVRLSPEAERLIARYTWPRNVVQLRDALQHALRNRPVGEIQAMDLPGYCHTANRHTLSPLELAERDTIIAALAEHQGNRVAAASHLGMSRSTLYRKIGAYGIVA